MRRPSRGASITSLGQVMGQAAPPAAGNLPPPMGPPPQAPLQNAIANRRSSKDGPVDSAPVIPARPFNETNPFATNEPFTNMATNSEPSNQERPVLAKRDSQTTVDEIKDEVDDTMRNLRKTFAGIFGDM